MKDERSGTMEKQTDGGLRVINLQAQNIKGLKAIDITPDDNVVLITGKNGAGKSTILDSIAYALCGSRSLPGKPVRKGMAAGEIKLTLGNGDDAKTVVVHLNVNGADGKTRLKVTNLDGSMEFKSPQSMLDAITDARTIDPLAFARMKPKEQMSVLLGLANVDFGLEDWQEQYNSVYQERRSIGRQRDDQVSYAKELHYIEGLPEQEESLTDIGQKLSSANALQVQNDNARKAVSDQRNKAADLEQELARIQGLMKETQKELVRLEDVASKLPDDPDIETLQSKLDSQEGVNAGIRANKVKKDADSKADELVSKYNAKSELLLGMEQEKSEALDVSSLGIKELGIDGDMVLYNGIPFNQASSSQQLRVSLKIAMALKPDVRVLRVYDGSLLDSDSMAIIRDEVGEQGYQIWIERVDETGEVGIYIEDGEIK